MQNIFPAGRRKRQFMRIFICGDSTAASYDPKDTPIVGWGQLLEQYLPNAQIVNAAFPGRSTRTFLAEGRLQRIEGKMSPGDAVLIQFGHNDEGTKPERHTEPWTDFTENLTVFIETARKHGAMPVLMTPICIRLWENGELQPTHGEYLLAVKKLAEGKRVPLIDLYEESFRTVRSLGEEESRKLYRLSVQAPEEQPDNAHTVYAGADAYARAAAKALKTILEKRTEHE